MADKTDSPQHIVALDIKDTLRINALHIEPNGEPVVIGGKNMAGKSAALQTIRMLLGGGREIPAEPVRRGARKAEAVLETEDFIVRRVLTKDGKRQKFEVRSRDGGPVKKPQEFLDSMRGKTAFDPLYFANADRHEQLAIMKRVAGVDTEKVDGQIAGLEEDRKNLGRDVKRAQGAMDSSAFHEGVDEAETSIVDLSRELETAQAANRANREMRDELQTLRSTSTALKSEIEELERTLEEKRAERDGVIAKGKELAEKVEQLEDVDVEAIRGRLGSIEETNKKARENAEHKRLVAEWEKLADQHAELTQKIDAAREERHAMVGAASFPVDGLALSEDGVTLNGLPFEQASGGETLRVSVAVALVEAAKAQLRVMLIDRAEELDEENLAMVLEMASEAGVQVIMARRSVGEECSIIIEDGAVAESKAA